MFETEKQAKVAFANEKPKDQQPGYEIYPLGAKDTKAQILFNHCSSKETTEAGDSKLVE